MNRLRKQVISAVLLVWLVIVSSSVPLTFAVDNGSLTAVFNCGATGRGFVIWDGYPSDPPTPYTYFENTLEGFIACRGSALVVKTPEEEWYVTTTPDAIQSSGILAVEWKQKGRQYELMMAFSANGETSGIFLPQLESFLMPLPGDPPNLPIPGISEQSDFLFYRGVLTEKQGNTMTRRWISGDATLTVYEHMDIYRLYFIFAIDLGEGASTIATLGWLNQDMKWMHPHLYGATTFYHNVDVETSNNDG